MQTYTQRNMASIVSLFPSLISSVSATRLGLSSGVGGGGSSAPLRPLDAVVDLRLLLLMISKVLNE
jgi:hypothetical protein